MSPASTGLCFTDRETEALELELRVQPLVSDYQGLLNYTILPWATVPLCLGIFIHSFNIYSILPQNPCVCLFVCLSLAIISKHFPFWVCLLGGQEVSLSCRDGT